MQIWTTLCKAAHDFPQPFPRKYEDGFRLSESFDKGIRKRHRLSRHECKAHTHGRSTGLTRHDRMRGSNNRRRRRAEMDEINRDFLPCALTHECDDILRCGGIEVRTARIREREYVIAKPNPRRIRRRAGYDIRHDEACTL